MRPVPGFKMTTPYGKRGTMWSCRRDSRGRGIHTGADFAAPEGTLVVAARPGQVAWVNHGSAFGNHQLEVAVFGGTRDFYAHMRYRLVDHGDVVKAGQPIGYVGSEGNVTGPHLHFERHSVESGPWSCATVRSPRPSIGYRPAAGAVWRAAVKATRKVRGR